MIAAMRAFGRQTGPQGGFTLLEVLVVVISIVILVTAILLMRS
jgi:type II secretory pathway pseudopilin PulG